MKLKLDMPWYLLNVCTKFQIDILMHVEKSPENSDERTDGHCHGIMRPFFKWAYTNIKAPHDWPFVSESTGEYGGRHHKVPVMPKALSWVGVCLISVLVPVATSATTFISMFISISASISLSLSLTTSTFTPTPAPTSTCTSRYMSIVGIFVKVTSLWFTHCSPVRLYGLWQHWFK